MEARLGHPRGGVRHGERRRTRASLRLHNPVPAFWMRTAERPELFGGELGAGVGLGEEGRMVMPAWPPTEGTSTSLTSRPFAPR